MPGLSRHLKQLEKELLALGEETMLIEELDGFIAGLLVCPDLIKPGEWLPIVWGQDSADPQPAFDNLEHVNRVLGLLMEHYNDVARTLMDRPDRYSPLFAVDERNSDILWELWIEGFEKGRQLTPGNLAKTAQYRCRHGDGDAWNADACRYRTRRSTPFAEGPRCLDRDSRRRYPALDRHTQ